MNNSVYGNPSSLTIHNEKNIKAGKIISWIVRIIIRANAIEIRDTVKEIMRFWKKGYYFRDFTKITILWNYISRYVTKWVSFFFFFFRISYYFTINRFWKMNKNWLSLYKSFYISLNYLSFSIVNYRISIYVPYLFTIFKICIKFIIVLENNIIHIWRIISFFFFLFLQN